MRGPDEQTSHMFSYIVPEHRVRQDHPLRPIRRMTDEVLATLSPRFDAMYSDIGRPSIPPEQLLRALLLQSLYTIRSERLLMEEIDARLHNQALPLSSGQLVLLQRDDSRVLKEEVRPGETWRHGVLRYRALISE